MPKYWFDHVHLVSPDPIKTAEFYQKTFGARKEGVQNLPDGRTLVSVALGDAALRITNPRKPPLVPGMLPTGYGIEHFGLRTDNLEAAVASLKSQGMKFVQEITVLPSGTKISFFLTPENVLVELLEPKA